MDSLKNKIIEKIMILLENNFPNNPEILNFKEDIENNNIDNLLFFINDNYKNIDYSKEIKQFVKSLVKSKLISENYLLKIDNISYIDHDPKTIFNLSDSRPIQLKNSYIYHINLFKEKTNPLNINKTKEEYIKEKILESRRNYLNDPIGFIANLEFMDSEDIYNTFANSHDITLIQHCISKLSLDTLNRLLIFVEDKITDNHYDVMSIFIEEAIKRNLHNKKIA